MENLKPIFFILLISPLIHLYSQNWNPPKDGVDLDTTFSITISKNLPNYFLRYQEYSESDKETSDDNQTYYRVELKKTIMGKPFQVIQSESYAYNGPLDFDLDDSGENYGVDGITIDINFDGYKDLRFRKSEGTGRYRSNGSYDFYVFNPKKNNFELNEDLSNVTNPTPFPDRKIVFSYTKDVLRDGIVEEYKWEGRNLVLLKSYKYQAIEDGCKTKDDNYCNYKRLTEYYRNNKIIKSKSEIIKFKNIPEYHLRW
jgi:hypothetical protein